MDKYVEKYVKLSAFRDRLRHAMQFENLNVKELAQKAGCNTKTICAALNKNQDKGPRMATIYKWSNALDVTYEWLAFGKIPEQPHKVVEETEVPLEEYLTQHVDEITEEYETDDANDSSLRIIMNISGTFNAQEVRDLVAGLGDRKIKIEATISAI